uniref:Arf-GAP with coiled-coil, ANK repeat and PH domain-containing protein n=1 Tax=Scophthalmus maximus TaxID=52904 RepID=A0A8D3EC21_SCOMX
MKLCGRMVEAGQAYSSANQLFLSSLAELSVYQRKDSVITVRDHVKLMLMLIITDVFLCNVFSPTSCFLFLPQLAETRREFVRIGVDLETAAVKNAQVSRHRAVDAERASHLLLATRKCHQHFALDYCLQLNTFKTQQRVDILNSVFSFVQAQFTFFHQGFDLLRDLDPTMKTMAAQLSQLSTDCAAERKELENKHLLVQQRVRTSSPLTSDPESAGIVDMIHFLIVNLFSRCWFSIRDNRLLYRKSHKDDAVVLFHDLRLCAVKSLEHVERRFCFELLSVQMCCALQADSEKLKQAWLSALQGSIHLAYREGARAQLTQAGSSHLNSVISPSGSVRNFFLLKGSFFSPPSGPGNRRCCDCEEEEPRWASINLGVTMCIECSGIHRSLGVHLSKVRSLTLDSWEAEQLKLFCVLGNDVMNRIYEARCSEEGLVKPTSDSSRAEKETWIKEKYVEKRFVRNSGADGARESDAGLRLYRSALAGDLVAMAAALAEGAAVNGSNAEEEGRTALIGATVGGSLLACEFLLQNGANVNHRDLRGRGSLHAAATAGHTGQVCLLLKRGANQYAVDERGQDPLAIAVETAHADIVTLLRMARMNEEMRDSEGVFGSAGDDETFQDIFRDFSNMASHDPEKLSRRQFSRGREEDDEEEEEQEKR